MSSFKQIVAGQFVRSRESWATQSRGTGIANAVFICAVVGVIFAFSSASASVKTAQVSILLLVFLVRPVFKSSARAPSKQGGELVAAIRADKEIMEVAGSGKDAAATKLIAERFNVSLVKASDGYHHVSSVGGAGNELDVIFTDGQPKRKILNELIQYLAEGDRVKFTSFKNSKTKVVTHSGLGEVEQGPVHSRLQHFGFDIELHAPLNTSNKAALEKLMIEHPEPDAWRCEADMPEDVEILNGDKLLCRWQRDFNLVEVANPNQ